MESSVRFRTVHFVWLTSNRSSPCPSPGNRGILGTDYMASCANFEFRSTLSDEICCRVPATFIKQLGLKKPQANSDGKFDGVLFFNVTLGVVSFVAAYPSEVWDF